MLDVVHTESPSIGSYIVSEYALGQSLELILSQGPLSGLEAAWVTREVADALAGVHSLRLYHERINPDTVIITPDGNVKIVGLLIEAALRPPQSASVHGADTPSRSTSSTWAGCSTPAWSVAGPAGPRTGCRTHRWSATTGPRPDRSGPVSRPRWTTSATKFSAIPPRHQPERSPAPAPWSSR